MMSIHSRLPAEFAEIHFDSSNGSLSFRFRASLVSFPKMMFYQRMSIRIVIVPSVPSHSIDHHFGVRKSIPLAVIMAFSTFSLHEIIRTFSAKTAVSLFGK